MLARSTIKKQILDIVERHRGEAGIVYCTSRKEVDTLAAWLAGSGLRALPYHAGLSDDERSRNQDAFLSERCDLVVATVAFGMGIDRSDVRFVVHAGAPRSLEHYQQEAGRAGRDGLEAECVLIFSGADFLKWRVMLERSGELTDATRALLRDMERYAGSVGCRHKHLVEYFGEPVPRANCAACDYCLEELESVPDPVLLARKILAAVARVGQRFGMAHVTNVLVGKESEQVRSRGHHELSTFGLLKDASVPEIRGYIEQLAANQLLRQTDDDYPVLQLTAKGLALMKDPASMPDLRSRSRRAPRRCAAPGARRWRSSRGRMSIAICSIGCVPSAWKSPVRAACRRTSSSTTRRCARWRACAPPPSTPSAPSTASAPAKPTTSAISSSRRSANTLTSCGAHKPRPASIVEAALVLARRLLTSR